MQPSRRAVLRLLSASALPFAGCTATGPTTGERDVPTRSTASPTASDEPAFEARLVGPDTGRRLFGGADVAAVGSVQQGRGGSFYVPLTLTGEATSAVSETFRTVGVAETPEEFDIELRHERETQSRFGISPGLATAIAENEWDGRMRLTFRERETATAVRATLASRADETLTDAGA